MRTPDAFRGYWKIESMEMWDLDYIDLVLPGFIEFDDELMGNFQFGTVAGWLDCRVRQVADQETLEWSWEGQNDNDPGCGRGLARISGETLLGHIFLHRGDDSSFVASRRATRPLRVVRRRRAAP